MPSAVKMAPKLTKNQMRRAKKKEQKKDQSQVSGVEWLSRSLMLIEQATPTPEPEIKAEPEAVPAKTEDGSVDLSTLEISEDDPNFAMFKGILDRFGASAEDQAGDEVNG